VVQNIASEMSASAQSSSVDIESITPIAKSIHGMEARCGQGRLVRTCSLCLARTGGGHNLAPVQLAAIGVPIARELRIRDIVGWFVERGIALNLRLAIGRGRIGVLRDRFGSRTANNRANDVRSRCRHSADCAHGELL